MIINSLWFEIIHKKYHILFQVTYCLLPSGQSSTQQVKAQSGERYIYDQCDGSEMN